MKSKPMTIGDAYGPAMNIKTKKEADIYFEKLVKMTMDDGKTREEAEVIQRGNLGYFAGYYDTKTRIRVEKLFGCAHPIFGKAAVSTPTADEALQAGIKLGKKGGKLCRSF